MSFFRPTFRRKVEPSPALAVALSRTEEVLAQLRSLHFAVEVATSDAADRQIVVDAIDDIEFLRQRLQ